MTQRAKQTGGPNSFEWSGFLPVVKRWWWLLLISAVLAGFSGHLVFANTAPKYESRAKLVVGPINTDADTIKAAGALVQLYAELATSRPLLQATVTELNLPMTPEELKAVTTATADDVKRLLTIRVQDADPGLAAKIANNLGDNLAELTSRGTARAEGALSVVDAAEPGTRVGAQSAFIVALAAAAGLLGVFTLVLLVEYLRDAVRGESDLSELANTTFLGAVTGVRRRFGPARPLVVEDRPGSRAAAGYRLLAAEIEFSGGTSPPRSLLVVGSQSGAGTGEVVANLAVAFAGSGRRVMLVDADYGRGEVSGLLGLDEQMGVSDLLKRTELLERGNRLPRHFHSTRTPTLGVLPRGSLNGTDAVEVDRVRALLEHLLRESELVVISGAPVQDSASTLTWAHCADATVIAAIQDVTKRSQLSDTVESLRIVGANLVGTVLTESGRFRDRWGLGRTGGHRHGESAYRVADDGRAGRSGDAGGVPPKGSSQGDDSAKPRRTVRRVATDRDSSAG